MSRSYIPNRIIIEGTLIADTPIRQTLPDLDADKNALPNSNHPEAPKTLPPLPVPKTAFQLGPNVVEKGLPYLTANGLRGALRTILATRFLQNSQLPLEAFPLKHPSDLSEGLDSSSSQHAPSGALKVLYAGGEAAKGSEGDYSPQQLEQRRQALPTFALLGASVFGAFFKGRLMVHRGLPALRSTQAHAARAWIIPVTDYSNSQVALTYPDLDPTALTFIESMARNQRAEILGDSGKHKDPQGNQKGTGSMVFQQESILAGITFLVRWELQAFDWERPEDVIQLGALLDALTLFYQIGQFGANANTGHGRFHGSLYINADPVTRTTDTQGHLFLATAAPGLFSTAPTAWESIMDAYTEFCVTHPEAIATALRGLETTPEQEFVRHLTNAESKIANFVKSWTKQFSDAIRAQTLPEKFAPPTLLDQLRTQAAVWTELYEAHQAFTDDPIAGYSKSQRHKMLPKLKDLAKQLQHDLFTDLPEFPDLNATLATLQQAYDATWAPRLPEDSADATG